MLRIEVFLNCGEVTGVFLFIIVYDVTRRETFTNLSDIWAREVELYSSNPECIRILVGNKVDRVSLLSAFCSQSCQNGQP